MRLPRKQKKKFKKDYFKRWGQCPRKYSRFELQREWEYLYHNIHIRISRMTVILDYPRIISIGQSLQWFRQHYPDLRLPTEMEIMSSTKRFYEANYLIEAQKFRPPTRPHKNTKNESKNRIEKVRSK